MNRPMGIGDFLIELKEAQTTVKGDLPGHEFHGNQYSDGGGSSGGNSSESSSSGSGQSLSSESGSAKNKKETIDSLKKKGLSPVEKKGNQLRRGDVVIDEDRKVWLVTSASPVNVVASAVTAPHSDRSGLFIQSGPGKSMALDRNHIVAGNEKQYARTIKETT